MTDDFVYRRLSQSIIYELIEHRRLVRSAPSNCADSATYEVTDPEP